MAKESDSGELESDLFFFCKEGPFTTCPFSCHLEVQRESYLSDFNSHLTFNSDISVV